MNGWPFDQLRTNDLREVLRVPQDEREGLRTNGFDGLLHIFIGTTGWRLPVMR